jgi:hypothetical protein
MKLLAFGIVTLLLSATQLPLSTDAAMSPNKQAKALERAHFSPYNGKQQDWPTSQKPFLDVQNTKYGIPIYRDLPGKPYELLGTIKTGGSDTLKHAVEAAQAANADAILCADDKAFADLGVKPQMTVRGTASGKVDFLEGVLIRWKK